MSNDIQNNKFNQCNALSSFIINSQRGSWKSSFSWIQHFSETIKCCETIQWQLYYLKATSNKKNNTNLPWFNVLKRSWITMKSGRMSGSSAQHCLIIFTASGGAEPLLTDGRISGGGLFSFSRISWENEQNKISHKKLFSRLCQTIASPFKANT